jgi:membrane protein required for colicin V production
MNSLSPVDWAVIAILFVAFLSGLAQGFFRSICGLGGLILALVAAAWNYHRLAASLFSFIHEEAVASTVAFLLIFIVVIAAAGFLGNLLAKTFKLIGLGWLDGLAGGIFGLVEGVVVITILILVVVAFFPQAHWLADAQLPRQFFSATHLSSRIAPSELGDRIRQGLEQWEKQSEHWLHR